MIAREIIKSWFKTGSKPTQEQFREWIDSFWHKDEMIPISKIEGIQPIYNALNSQNTLLAKAKIYAPGQFIIKKANSNTNELALEAGDLCEGIVQGYDIKGVYKGGDTSLLGSYIVITQDEIPPLEFLEITNL